MKRFLTSIVLLFLISSQLQAEDLKQVQSFITKYCADCHSGAEPEAERSLDQFVYDTKNEDELTELEDVLNALNLGDMPPKEDDVKQPTSAETKQVIDTLAAYLLKAQESSRFGSTVIRRLNRHEYINTMRDLLGVHTESFDPTGEFPEDAIDDGFNNIGASLILSDYQLQRYLESAEAFLEEAIYFNEEQPKKQTWHIPAAELSSEREYTRAKVSWRLNVNNEYVEIGHGKPIESHPTYSRRFAARGVPEDGYYTIRVKAEAKGRVNSPYDPKFFDIDMTHPLKMGLWIAPTYELLNKRAAEGRKFVALFDLKDDEPDVYEATVWLTKRSTPFVHWSNGVSSKGTIKNVSEKYHPEVIRANNTLIDAAERGDKEAAALVEKLAKNENSQAMSEVYVGPRVRVYHMEIEGPIYKTWPPKSHQMLFGDQLQAHKVDLPETFRKFASRAFRQPVTQAEVQHYVDFAKHRIAQGDTSKRAIMLGLTAILTSPRFLYLDEGNDETDELLSSIELASRLSYFLWSSMPDQRLSDLANRDQLTHSATIKSQTHRMLNDEKSTALVEHFTDSWLRLNTLGSMPPDSKTFKQYYNDRLEIAMKQETRLYFKNLLDTNGSILDLLDSDYSFINGSLARLYGIEGVKTEEFQRVTLPSHLQRGGLLGQASILTLTANGIETSPVVRGVWVLENILGTPPSPPPPDVEPLEPDTRGATTIREQLSKHRNVAACANCHAKIDPLGFALEFYDPIGAFRTNYPGQGKRTIDGAGKLPTGEAFSDPKELKQLLLARKDQFTLMLTEKLLTYATGRKMALKDQAEIQQIADQIAADGYHLRDLVTAVAQSQIFRSK
ncbi:MAG: hypothetical protein COA78_11295 [Blastopirellula sp.]|nr:MAG: hypothetical protein COA78_11295 [Blastopirellula sp.]